MEVVAASPDPVRISFLAGAAARRRHRLHGAGRAYQRGGGRDRRLPAPPGGAREDAAPARRVLREAGEAPEE